MQPARDLQDLHGDEGSSSRDILGAEPYAVSVDQQSYARLDVASQRGLAGSGFAEHAASPQLASSSSAFEQASTSQPEQQLTDAEPTAKSTRSSRGRPPDSSDKAVGPWVVSSTDMWQLLCFLSTHEQKRTSKRRLTQVSNRKVQKRYRERQKVREPKLGQIQHYTEAF